MTPNCSATPVYIAARIRVIKGTAERNFVILLVSKLNQYFLYRHW
jgi:hypothetical protein